MSKDPRVEEALLKFFYGECSVDELQAIHREICDSDECQRYLEQVRDLLYFLKSAESAQQEKSVNWDDLRSKFDKVLTLLATDGSHNE
jgi:hypothetical protein